MHSRRWAAVFALAAAGLTGCSSAGAHHASSGPNPAAITPAATASAPAGSAGSTAASTPTGGDLLTGYGATVAAWNAHHVADPDFAPGSVYNRDPSLPHINGHTGAVYVEVNAMGGRIRDYVMNLPEGTRRDQALAIAEKEMPADVQVLWQATRDSCVQAELVSATLTRVLGTGNQVLVELEDVRDDGSDAAKPTVFNSATFTPDNSAAAADAPTC